MSDQQKKDLAHYNLIASMLFAAMMVAVVGLIVSMAVRMMGM